MNDFFAFCRLYKWRILSVCCGILFAILIFTIGFWRTLLLFAIVGIAYFIGTLLDEGGRGRVKEFFLGLFKPRNNG